MSARFKGFGTTPLGRALTDIIDTPDRPIELKAFSREGFAAVTALVTELSPLLLPLKADDPAGFDEAKKFVGWYVGGIMRGLGYDIDRRAARVPGKLFTVAATWKPAQA